MWKVKLQYQIPIGITEMFSWISEKAASEKDMFLPNFSDQYRYGFVKNSGAVVCKCRPENIKLQGKHSTFFVIFQLPSEFLEQMALANAL